MALDLHPVRDRIKCRRMVRFPDYRKTACRSNASFKVLQKPAVRGIHLGLDGIGGGVLRPAVYVQHRLSDDTRRLPVANGLGVLAHDDHGCARRTELRSCGQAVRYKRVDVRGFRFIYRRLARLALGGALGRPAGSPSYRCSPLDWPLASCRLRRLRRLWALSPPIVPASPQRF